MISDKEKPEGTPKILPLCYKVAEHENIIWVCDGAANVGQIGHQIGVLLTNMDKARMCCTTAVAAGSKPHLDIAARSKKNIVIDGCGNRCASKVLENAAVKIGYSIDISKYLQKVPTLDIYQADVKRIAEIVVKEAHL
ncbi:MAG: zinc-binding protein [Candidatus Methanomethylicia archaeon]|nr:zinc-binding protein [Candidatus Methanomethylicia archaeon]